MPRQRKPRPSAPPPPEPNQSLEHDPVTPTRAGASDPPPPGPSGQDVLPWVVPGRRVYPPRTLAECEDIDPNDPRFPDGFAEWPALWGHYLRLFHTQGSLDAVVSGLATWLAWQAGCPLAAIKALPLAEVLRILEPPQAKRVRPQEMEARDKWIYRQCCNEDLDLKAILKRLREQCQKKGWSEITTIQGIRRAAADYADRHGLGRPPRRQGR